MNKRAVLMLNTGVDSWKRDDEQWFRRNPKRSHRARPLVDGEWPTLRASSAAFIIVRQLAPGVRARRPIILPPWLELPEDDDDFLAAAFDTVEAEAKGGPPSTPERVWSAYVARTQHATGAVQ